MPACWLLAVAGTVAAELITDPVLDEDEIYAKLTEVTIKTIAEKVVILFNSGTAPSVPKSDWLDPPPPKAAPASAPFPCWSRTMMTSFLGTLVFYGLILLVAQTTGLLGKLLRH